MCSFRVIADMRYTEIVAIADVKIASIVIDLNIGTLPAFFFIRHNRRTCVQMVDIRVADIQLIVLFALIAEINLTVKSMDCAVVNIYGKIMRISATTADVNSGHVSRLIASILAGPRPFVGNGCIANALCYIAASQIDSVGERLVCTTVHITFAIQSNSIVSRSNVTVANQRFTRRTNAKCKTIRQAGEVIFAIAAYSCVLNKQLGCCAVANTYGFGVGR